MKIYLFSKLYIYKFSTFSFPEHWEPETETYEDLLIASLLMADELTNSLETQYNGAIMIVDFQNLGLKHVRQATPSRARYIARVAQVKNTAIKNTINDFETNLFTLLLRLDSTDMQAKT